MSCEEQVVVVKNDWWVELYDLWYSKVFVQFEIVKLCQGKCLTVLGGFNERGFKVHNLSYWASNVAFWSLKTKPSSIYRSISNHVGLPIFSFNLVERAVTRKKFFADDYMDTVVSFDRVLDVDNPGKKSGDLVGGFIVCKRVVRFLVDYFSSKGERVAIVHSGSGFNIYLNGCMSLNGFEGLRDLCVDLNNSCDGLLDTSVFEVKRVFKVPYTLDFKTGHVVLPVSLLEFETFGFNDYLPDVVLKKVRVKGRGLVWLKN